MIKQILIVTALMLVGCGGAIVESNEKQEAFLKGHRMAYFEACLALRGELDHPIFSLTQEELFNSRDSVLSSLLFQALTSEECEEVSGIHMGVANEWFPDSDDSITWALKAMPPTPEFEIVLKYTMLLNEPLDATGDSQ